MLPLFRELSAMYFHFNLIFPLPKNFAAFQVAITWKGSKVLGERKNQVVRYVFSMVQTYMMQLHILPIHLSSWMQVPNVAKNVTRTFSTCVRGGSWHETRFSNHTNICHVVIVYVYLWGLTWVWAGALFLHGPCMKRLYLLCIPYVSSLPWSLSVQVRSRDSL